MIKNLLPSKGRGYKLQVKPLAKGQSLVAMFGHQENECEENSTLMWVSYLYQKMHNNKKKSSSLSLTTKGKLLHHRSNARNLLKR